MAEPEAALVLTDDLERRAGYGLVNSERGCYSLHETGLSAAKISVESEYATIWQLVQDPGGQGPCFRGACCRECH